MLSVGWFVVAVVVAVVLTMWFTFTLTRLDRLHARVDAAQAALDAQLVRRAAALQHVAEWADSRLPDADRARFEAAARTALAVGRDSTAEGAARENAENVVGRAVVELVGRPDTARSEAVAELFEAAARVLIARRFYNDAVRDTRSLRSGRLPRLFRMAGRREMPQFFDIDDTQPTAIPTASPPPVSRPAPSDATSPRPASPGAEPRTETESR